MKRIMVLLSVVLGAAMLFVACSSAQYQSSSTAIYAEPYTGSGNTMARDYEMAVAKDGGESSQPMEIMQENRKIIYTSNLYIESTNFDDSIAQMQSAIKAVNGYVSSTSLDKPTYDGATRYATYEYRVPSENYTDFLTKLSESGNVVSQYESTQDITLEYVDLEARLQSLYTQKASLEKMLSEATEIETLLAVQEQLSEVQYRIESYTAQQRTYDNLVSYCTVNVSINEVKYLTQAKETFGQRITVAFEESWRDFGENMQIFVVGLVYFFPLIIIALLITALIALVTIKKRKNIQLAKNEKDFKQSGKNENDTV